MEPVLLECNLVWGVAGGIPSASLRVNSLCDSAPGMPSGAHRPDVLREEHPGRLTPPMGESSDLNPWCYLAARWILVWASSPYRCIQLLPENPRPNHKFKESVAWKKEKKQVLFDTLPWTSISIIQ